MCGTAKIPDQCDKAAVQNSSVIFFANDGQECESLLKDDIQKRKTEIIEDDAYPKDGITMQDTKGGFIVVAKCNSEKKKPEFSIDSKNNLLIESDGNCGIENTIAKFLDDNKWIVSLILILFGVVLLLIGGSHWDKILTVVGFLVGSGGILVILFAFVKIKTDT